MKNTYLQFAQIITGAVVGILLTIHMAGMHLDAVFGFFGIVNDTSWASMMERSREGVWAGIYIALLAFGLFMLLTDCSQHSARTKSFPYGGESHYLDYNCRRHCFPCARYVCAAGTAR